MQTVGGADGEYAPWATAGAPEASAQYRMHAHNRKEIEELGAYY